MMSGVDKRDLRQAKCINRGKSARLYGRLLIPVACVVLGQALWSDPDLGPQLSEGLTEIKPVLATYAQGTPLDGAFGPVPEATENGELVIIDEAKAATSGAVTASFNLPESATPVNRP